MVKRSRHDIVRDMLAALSNKSGRMKPTRLMYKANLSHPQMQGYLMELEGKGFIQRQEEKKQQWIVLTNKGFEYANKLVELQRFEESFGL